jgi:hypothetical protein
MTTYEGGAVSEGLRSKCCEVFDEARGKFILLSLFKIPTTFIIDLARGL